MVFEEIIFGTAILGSGVAAAYDLKTTEVPNWVFYVMLAVGVPSVIAYSLLSSGIESLAFSTATGVGLLGLGYLMYRLGQWGGADMVLLAIIGFLMTSTSPLFPGETAFPFGISFLFNLFIIGAAYMVAYAAIFAMRNKAVITNFKSNMMKSTRLLIILCISMVAVFTVLMFYLSGLVGGLTNAEMARGIALPILLTVAFMVVYKFAKSVETYGFKTRIPVSRLKAGDMLLDERKLIGITQEQVNRIRRSGKRYVWIKDGVRFVPAFPLALLFTLYVGDAILLVRLLF